MSAECGAPPPGARQSLGAPHPASGPTQGFRSVARAPLGLGMCVSAELPGPRCWATLALPVASIKSFTLGLRARGGVGVSGPHTRDRPFPWPSPKAVSLASLATEKVTCSGAGAKALETPLSSRTHLLG